MSTRKRVPRIRLEAGDRQAGILAVAEELFAQHGFRGVSLEAVAVAVGVTKAGLLHHFPSKEAVLVALLEKRDRDDVAALRSLAPGAAEARTFGKDALREALTQLVDRNADQPQLIRLYTVLNAEALDPDHPAADYFGRRRETAVRTLQELSGGWHPEPHSFAVQVLAVMDGLQLAWLRDPSLDLRQEWERCAMLIFDGPA